MRKFLLLIVFTFLNLIFVSAQQKPLTAYIAISEECPVCIFMSKTLREIEQTYKDSVAFNLIFPTSPSSYKTISQFKNKYKLTSFESILDSDQSRTKKLNITITPEVVLMNNEDSIIYKGRINDAFISPGKSKKSNITNDFENAISLWIEKKEKLTEWKNAVGCFITFSRN